MGEVDGPKISVNKVNYGNFQKSVAEAPTEGAEQENTQIKNFANDKAESLGRSLLFKGKDSINNDLKAMLDNPQIPENSDKMFETAYASAQKLGLANPYEEAASMATVNNIS